MLTRTGAKDDRGNQPPREGLNMTDSRPGTGLPTRQQYLPEHDGVVVNLIMGRVDKRDRTFSRQVVQSFELLAMFLDLLRIASAEFFPAGWIVSEPFSQFRARREFFCPMVYRSVGLLETSRPKPIHKHPRAVVCCRALIGPLHFHSFPGDVFSHRFRSDTH